MASTPSPSRALETKARILDAAQALFAEEGFFQAGVRDIAERAGVTSSLVLKYFGSKANLFATALTRSLEEAVFRTDLKPAFGRLLVAAIADPGLRITAPAMIALSLGDDQARTAAATIVREQTLEAVADWLGPADAEARAATLMMLAIGYAIFHRHLQVGLPEAVSARSSQWVADAVQALVDGKAAPDVRD